MANGICPRGCRRGVQMENLNGLSRLRFTGPNRVAESHQHRVCDKGYAFIDRALYLPKAWTFDPDRLARAHVPETVEFATKPKLAVGMIARAVAAQVPFAWVIADSVYGVGELETALRRSGKGYVLGVNANHWFGSWHPDILVAGEAKTIAQALLAAMWKRLSAGHGTKGERLQALGLLSARRSRCR